MLIQNDFLKACGVEIRLVFSPAPDPDSRFCVNDLRAASFVGHGTAMSRVHIGPACLMRRLGF
jgi:hypothetical protein